MTILFKFFKLNFKLQNLHTGYLYVFGYEEAIKENKYVGEINPFISENFWMIGRTGQD